MSNKEQPDENISKINDADLKKAMVFLMSKEMKDFSLEKKKEFLLKKLPLETVEKAISIYPLIESNIVNQIEEYKTNHSKEDTSIFKNFFNFNILSSVLLTSIGINYLIDLNRNKKNDLFFKDCEKKINEDMEKTRKELKSVLEVELNEYVTKESLKDKVGTQIAEYTQQRGLNLNLSSKTVKDDIAKLKEEVEAKDKLIKEINVKIENSKVLLKQEIVKETQTIIEENNNKLLMKIIENQDKLMLVVSDAINKANKNTISTNNTNLETFNDYKLNMPNLSNADIIPESKNIVEQEEQQDFKGLVEVTLESAKEDKDKIAFIKQLKNQFSAILETFKKEQKREGLPFINLTNRSYKSVNSSLLSQLLKKVGFKNDTGSVYKFEGSVEDLEQAIEQIELFDKN